MVKLVYCLRRRADISAEEFYRYWLNTHGPKVKNASEALRALRYIQSHMRAGGKPSIRRFARPLASLRRDHGSLVEQHRGREGGRSGTQGSLLTSWRTVLSSSRS